jgi:hypothetical protein
MAVLDGGSSTAGKVNVTPTFELEVAPSLEGSGVRCFSEVDGGRYTLEALNRSPEASNDYRLRAASDSVIFEYQFNATAQNTAKWKHGFTTMSANQSAAAGFLLLNANQATASGNGCSLQSYKHAALYGTTMLYNEMTFAITSAPLANQIFEAGHFVTTVPTPVTPADGIFIRITNAGLIGVLAHNGVETPSGVLVAFTDLPINTNMRIVLGVSQRTVEFWMDKQDGNDINLLGHIDVPAGNAQPSLSSSLPAAAFQMRNAALVGGGTQMQIKVGNGSVNYSGFDMVKPWSHQLVGSGNHVMQGQDGGTMGIVTAAANATAATTVTGAALAQATSLKTGLGGEAGITATVPGVDGSVWAWQNPAGSVSQTAKTAYITSIRIDSVNIGAPVAGTPTTVQWAVDFGSTALPLNTAESASFATWAAATGKIGRRKVVGLQTWTVGALVGAPAETIDLYIDPPIAVNPGEYFKIVAKVIQGTATASQVIWAAADVNGYVD